MNTKNQSSDLSPIHYPLADTLPEVGSSIELAPGVRWLRMRLPFALDHINLWLLRDEFEGIKGWTIVDCGIANDETGRIRISTRNGSKRSKGMIIDMDDKNPDRQAKMEKMKAQQYREFMDAPLTRMALSAVGSIAKGEVLPLLLSAAFDAGIQCGITQTTLDIGGMLVSSIERTRKEGGRG